MPLRLGTLEIDDLRLGTVQPTRVYLGTTIVWEPGGADIRVLESGTDTRVLENGTLDNSR